jgi:hypothetical protein
VDAEYRSEIRWASGAQIIFAEADGAARTGSATCAVAFWGLFGDVADFELPQLVMLSTETNTTSTRNVLC